MASAAEQLAAHINFGQLSKATELKKRLWFTLGALVISSKKTKKISATKKKA
jgi:preprotein translocase subunit SecY